MASQGSDTTDVYCQLMLLGRRNLVVASGVASAAAGAVDLRLREVLGHAEAGAGELEALKIIIYK